LGIGSDLNEPDNPLIADFYSVAEEPAPQPEAPVETASASSWDEVEDMRSQGFSGPVTVGGVEYNIAPISSAEGGAEMPVNTPEAPPEEAPSKGNRPRGGIRPEEPSEPIFRPTTGSAGRRNPTPGSAAADPEAGTDEQGAMSSSRGTNTSNRQNAATLRQVNAVKGDLEESGLIWPTNEQELEEYISGVDEAIDNFGPLPEEVYNMLIDQATQNVQN
jgi:hypothetical protein